MNPLMVCNLGWNPSSIVALATFIQLFHFIFQHCLKSENSVGNLINSWPFESSFFLYWSDWLTDWDEDEFQRSLGKGASTADAPLWLTAYESYIRQFGSRVLMRGQNTELSPRCCFYFSLATILHNSSRFQRSAVALGPRKHLRALDVPFTLSERVQCAM